MKFLFSLTLILFAFSVLGQPGGGGGFKIRKIVNVNGSIPEKLDIRVYALKDSSYQSKILEKDSMEFLFIPKKTVYRVEWDHHFVCSASDSLRGVEIPCTWSCAKNKRLVLIAQNDTMIIDIKNILPENGAGYSSGINTLVFEPGYFSIDAGDFIHGDRIPQRTKLSALTGVNYERSVPQSLLQEK